MTHSLKGQRYHCKKFLPHHFKDDLSGKQTHLGCGWYAKEIEGEVKLFYQLGGTLYREMSRACFETTMRNSTYFPTDEIKSKLKKFEEANNERKTQ